MSHLGLPLQAKTRFKDGESHLREALEPSVPSFPE